MKYFFAILMLLFSVVPLLAVYDLFQQGIEQLPLLSVPKQLYPLSFVCVGLIVFLAFLLRKQSDNKKSK